jgi:tripartite-type tricarboxylate transporter receptor subunit TctC
MPAARRQFLQICANAVAATAYASVAHAQAYPSKPITLIVPFPPGGSTDVVGRIVAERMRPLLGQPMVIENVGGAGGSIALGRVARATPDGYTIDIGQWDTHVGGIIYNINYNLQTDFTPIGLMTINPQLMVARKNMPADDLKGLVAYMKANPGRALLANQTATAQTSGIQLQELTGTTLQFSPYRGAGPALTDIVAGHVDMMFDTIVTSLPLHRAGSARIVAIANAQRSSALPNVPTFAESGMPDFRSITWFGCVAPAGTPASVAEKVHKDLVEVLARPEVNAKLAELMLEPVASAPAQAAQFFVEETALWGKVIRDTGVKAQ